LRGSVAEGKGLSWGARLGAYRLITALAFVVGAGIATGRGFTQRPRALAMWGHLKKRKFTYAKDCRAWFQDAAACESRLWPLAIGVPEIVARQADVLPAERLDVLEHARIEV
jgi:hypothetical protein